MEDTSPIKNIIYPVLKSIGKKRGPSSPTYCKRIGMGFPKRINETTLFHQQCRRKRHDVSPVEVPGLWHPVEMGTGIEIAADDYRYIFRIFNGWMQRLQHAAQRRSEEHTA